MGEYKVFSFVTSGWYRQVAEAGLIPSLDEFGLDYDIKEIPASDVPVGYKVSTLKVRFMREKLQEWNCPTVWLDADSCVVQRPSMLDDLSREGGFDVALTCHGRNPRKASARPVKRKHFHSLVYRSCTMLFMPTRNSIRLLEEWDDCINNVPHGNDQWALARAIPRAPGLRIVILPQEYAYVIQGCRKVNAAMIGEPVILQFYGSKAAPKEDPWFLEKIRNERKRYTKK